MPASTSPRHRSAGAPRTPLRDAAAATARSAAGVGRRSAVAAGTGGLLVSLLTGSASAHPSTDHAVPSVDTGLLTQSAREALALSPRVTVAATATWTFEAPALTLEADPPPPPPAPEPVPEPEHVHEASASPSTEPAPQVGAPAPASANGSAIVEVASRFVGVPYVWGGTTPDGFDCSGFTSYVYAQVGIRLPRTSSDQRNAGTVVSRADAQPGDLIWSPGHISIYAGGDLQVDAPVPGKTIQIREIWQSNPTFIRVTS